MSEQPGEDLQAAHGEEHLAAVWKGRDGWGGGLDVMYRRK